VLLLVYAGLLSTQPVRFSGSTRIHAELNFHPQDTLRRYTSEFPRLAWTGYPSGDASSERRLSASLGRSWKPTPLLDRITRFSQSCRSARGLAPGV